LHVVIEDDTPQGAKRSREGKRMCVRRSREDPALIVTFFIWWLNVNALTQTDSGEEAHLQGTVVGYLDGGNWLELAIIGCGKSLDCPMFVATTNNMQARTRSIGHVYADVGVALGGDQVHGVAAGHDLVGRVEQVPPKDSFVLAIADEIIDYNPCVGLERDERTAMEDLPRSAVIVVVFAGDPDEATAVDVSIRYACAAPRQPEKA
jgi:hypothetical protein